MAENTQSIRTLPGIGPKKAQLFAKLGIATLGDLLHFYPRDYEDRTKLLPIASLEADTPACFIASVVTNPQTHRIPKPGNRQLEFTKVVVADHTGRLNLTFFNASYTAQRLIRGETYCFYGTLVGDYLGYAMTNPLFEPLDSEGNVTRRIMPIYPLTAGLTNKQVAQAVQAALTRCSIEETIPESVREVYGLCDADSALREIHDPSSAEALEEARKRLIFEEFYVFSAALAIVRAKRTVRTVPAFRTDGMGQFYGALPFDLTGAQQRAIDDILSDFRSGKPMSRLVQGDVGCGKTMVAAAAAFCAIKNQKQTALMAPTEILAKQHADRLAPLLEPLGVRCVLLTGSLPAAQKKAVRQAIADGDADLIIGTHALLTEATVFHDLGLVIADEQHRFGVAQRAALLGKGEQPHLLIMSATPIPRTLALILYGDLDVSVIDELPPGRQPVETFLVDERYRSRLNGFIRKQAEEGHQTFIVCPAIEEGETESFKAAEQWAQTLKDSVFPNLRVALLHGRMKGAEKEAVMEAFAAQEYDILVATTVIEVGVDVPSATLMVVENADRFGLSQLHQLRGRIGRGGAKSYCILVSDNRNEETLARLKALCATADGFRIAEEDLKLRGPGDFFGSRQHGLPVFHIGNLAQDLNVLKQAQQAAAEMVAAGDISPALQSAVDALLNNDTFVMN
ncbi:MAG: ATP-dependent DNA helicase RecG [Oscillospiraceae bacterium]|nr:ATP-dependent DNA helicase RecG [Oscillospiraceae bacterium]